MTEGAFDRAARLARAHYERSAVYRNNVGWEELPRAYRANRIFEMRAALAEVDEAESSHIQAVATAAATEIRMRAAEISRLEHEINSPGFEAHIPSSEQRSNPRYEGWREAMAALREAGMEGSDLVTSFRTFVLRGGWPYRSVAEIVAQAARFTTDATPEVQNSILQRMFGSDAVRVASVLVESDLPFGDQTF